MGEQIIASMLRASMAIVEKEFYDQLKRQAVQQSLEMVRRQMLAEVANQFSKEVAYNAAQYIRALGAASVTIEVEGDPGEVIEQRFKKSVDKFEKWVDSQPPDSPVVTSLLEKYGVKKSGVYSYVRQQTVPIWQSIGKPRKEYWLDRTNQGVDISDFLSENAARIFNRLLSESPLSNKLSQNT